MAEPTPRLLTRGELRRVEDCLNENSKLADCWKSEKVVIVACEPTGAHLSNKPFIDLDILSPAEGPFPGSKTSERHPTRQICKKTIRILEKPKPKQSKRFGPRPWHSTYYFREQFSLYPDEAMAQAREIFAALLAQYVSICIVSHDLRDSLSSLQGIELPESTVLVDLIKVLEHQSRQSEQGIPEELKKYTDDNVAIRNGRYDRRPWPLMGYLGMPNIALLEVLGPAAESYRRDKTEKRDTAMKRIARRMAIQEIPVRNRGRS
ncbi:hypothetical protein Daus18300_001769 [Diaporthe australafricana]|uniref:Uncharacterized protein n=1 Tax=Diaporthe australafricana TaxID=127596 RepID=A0ABR3XT64_9PEZI